jgi:hypothetical protein
MFLYIVQWAYLTCFFFFGYVSTHCSMGICNMHIFFWLCFYTLFYGHIQWSYFCFAMFLHIVQWPYLTVIFLFCYVSTHCLMAIFNGHILFCYVSTHCSMAIFNGHTFFSLYTVAWNPMQLCELWPRASKGYRYPIVTHIALLAQTWVLSLCSFFSFPPWPGCFV